MLYFIIFLLVISEFSNAKGIDDHIYQECHTGGKIQCQSIPDGCINKKNCASLVKIEKGSKYKFKIFDTDLSDAYVGVAFSFDQLMGNDFLVEFVHGTGKGIYASYIPEEKNKEKVQPERVTDVKLSGEAMKSVDGVESGEWELDPVINIKGHTFNLNAGNLYILMARGSTDNGQLTYHEKHKTASKSPAKFS